MSKKRKLKEINKTLDHINNRLKEETRGVFTDSLRNLQIRFTNVKANLAQQIGSKKSKKG